MDECLICLCKIKKNREYAVINNSGENGIYHHKCLKLWLNKSFNGILTDYTIETYSIYKYDRYLSTQRANSVRSTEKDLAFIQLDSETTPLISDQSTKLIIQQNDESIELIQTNKKPVKLITQHNEPVKLTPIIKESIQLKQATKEPSKYNDFECCIII